MPPVAVRSDNCDVLWKVTNSRRVELASIIRMLVILSNLHFGVSNVTNERTANVTETFMHVTDTVATNKFYFKHVPGRNYVFLYKSLICPTLIGFVDSRICCCAVPFLFWWLCLQHGICI
jgi:hypothetical protein